MATVRDAIERPIRSWRVWPYGVWYVESCLAGGAYWGVSHGRSLSAAIVAALYLVFCGFVLLFPAHLLRLAFDSLRLGAARRILILQLLLACSAAAIIGTMAGGLGWWAPLAVLMSGNALWGLELEERSVASTDDPAGRAD